MSKPLKHRKCGFCRGSVPVEYTTCPYCDKSLEPYGPAHRLLEAILPEEQPITRSLIASMVGVYVLMGLVAGGTAIIAPSVYTLIHFGAMFPPYIVEGQWWRLVTALFLHGDLMHLGFNLYGLWILGPLIENSFGRARYLWAFAVSGVVSTLCSFAWSALAIHVAEAITIPLVFTPTTVSTFATPSVGMSGALTGLIGVGIAAGHKVNNPMGLEIRNQLLSWMGFIVVFGLVMPGVDNAAHFGGFLAGLGLGSIMPLKDRAQRIGGTVYGVLGALAAVLMVGALVLQGIAMPRNYPPDLDFYPTAIFGNVLRPADRDDSTFINAIQGCEAALEDIASASAEPSAALLKRAQETCLESKYYQPTNPYRYIASAKALAVNGERQQACADFLMGRRVFDSTKARYNQQFQKLLAVHINEVSSELQCD